MRRAIVAILITIAAGTAHAQTAEPAEPDFSPDHLRQIFTTTDEPPPPQRNFRVGFGVVEFRALGMDWRIGFLPLLAPLHGSVPATTKVLPDAFSLNQMQIPGGLPVPERDWNMKREMRRIARITANQ